MFAQDALLPIERENIPMNTNNQIQGIEDTAWRIAAKARQLERWREQNDATKHGLKQSRYANRCYFEQAANIHAQDIQIGHFALVNETKIEQSHSAKQDALWRGPYQVTEIAPSLGTYRLAQVDAADLAGWMDGSPLMKFFTRNEGVHGTGAIAMPNTIQEEESDELKEFEVEAVASWKQIDGRWLYGFK